MSNLVHIFEIGHSHETAYTTCSSHRVCRYSRQLVGMFVTLEMWRAPTKQQEQQQQQQQCGHMQCIWRLIASKTAAMLQRTMPNAE